MNLCWTTKRIGDSDVLKTCSPEAVPRQNAIRRYIGLIHRLGGGFGSSFRPGIGCSVTAGKNEISAKRRVSG
jgi:hypothetical protein